MEQEQTTKMNKKGKKGMSFLNSLIGIYVGTMILGMGIVWFLSPVGLVTGGVSGLAIAIEATTKFSDSEFLFGRQHLRVIFRYLSSVCISGDSLTDEIQ